MWRAPVCSGVLLLWLATTTAAATLIDPALRFRQLSTAHFTIYFHQGEDRQAARLAVIAEDVWSRVSSGLRLQAPRRTHVVLVNQSELANGWATPLPYDTVFVTAAAPAGSESIGRSDDWLRLVFTHEFTHIVHLDQSAGWSRAFRNLFGRHPLAFPNLLLPGWQVEGLATWEESALTGEGRRYAGDFRTIVRAAGAAGRFEPLDRVNGGLTDWPDGASAYAYGLGFHEFLAERFGEATFGRLASATARRLPFAGTRTYRGVYGSSLGELWSAYREAVERDPAGPDADASAADRAAPASRLTRHGFNVTGPRFAPACSDGRTGARGCQPEIVYSVNNPNGFPAMRAVRIDGTRDRPLTTRFLGSTAALAPGAILFDQQELRRNVGLYSDLFVFDRRTGAVRQLTHEARLQDPDLSPDRTIIAAVREREGQRDLVLVRWTAERPALELPVSVLVSEPGTDFNAPRFSPDGTHIAVERHRPGRLSDIAVVDVASGAMRSAASDPSARIVTPAWTPDGTAIVAAADYGRSPFDLYAYSVADASVPPRRLTWTDGATWPDISPDGATIAFVGYTTEGSDVFTVPFASRSAPRAVATQPAAARTGDPAPAATASADVPPAEPYRPWRTLLPTSWSPVLTTSDDQLRAGFAIAGADVLGRHAYSLSATWLLEGPSSAPGPPRRRPDWSAGYTYDRWRPTLFASASADTLFAAGPPDAHGRPAGATLDERQVEAGVLLPFRRVRRSHRLLASINRTDDRFTFSDALASVRQTSARVGWSSTTAHTYGYSISPEGGVDIGATAELARRSVGRDTTSTTVTADARGYVRGLKPHHVIALRAAAGRSSGSDAARVFHLGGSGPDRDVIDFDRDAISVLRAFPFDSFAGTHVALLNAEYRWPLARPQRGHGTFPLLLHTLHAAWFADAGHAWNTAFHRRDARTSIGGELSARLVIGYVLPLSVTAGGAWGRDGAHGAGARAAYIRIGSSF